jgi:hypothetical protein
MVGGESMIPIIKKLNPPMVWWNGFKWVTDRWKVGTKKNGFDLVPTFGDALQHWLWHCGVPPKIAFGWFSKYKQSKDEDDEQNEEA